ncbi:MAG: GNAT family N-acetyltransferase [Saprospiraceae bacterium]|nr:GNAT family N-acetyltransferase [Saprospiraceae bacterium]NNL91098.1 GNAT family N-acetyltransferase [Saprospiraceae bacterium]
MIKSLENIAPEKIIDCLHLSFSDYTLPVKMSYAYWVERWGAARIDYALSFGYFDLDDLVGFVLHGIDTRYDKISFFNMGTGVIPAFRGRKIVKQIYDMCYHNLVRAGCEQGLLEVLQNNNIAIRTYQSVGFKLSQELISYHGKAVDYPNDFIFIKIDDYNVEDYNHLKTRHLSWEQTDATITYNPNEFDCYELRFGNNLYGFAIIKKSNGNLTQFGVQNGNWTKLGLTLFDHISKSSPKYRIVNIDKRDTDLISFFKNNNFEEQLKQFEMRLAF